MFLDMDRFKQLNDTHGHAKGDALLIEVASRLRGCVRELDTVARLGGDEFVVMLENLSGPFDEAIVNARAVGNKILQALNAPYRLGELSYTSTPSIGLTLFSGKDDGIDGILKRADVAMYAAKSAGRNTLREAELAL
jgi:diguanylate cyclase (GGDEF)-like protein